MTGATGFVGGYTAKHLHAAGFDVIGTGRDPHRGAALEANGIRFAPVDLADRESLTHLCAQVDAVVHCAALSTAWASSSAYQAANVEGTHNLLAAAEAGGVSRFIHISTPAVLSTFGDQYELDEDTLLPSVFTSEYGASKAEAESLVEASPLETAVLRPKAIYGRGDTALLPRLVDAARRGRLRIIGDGSTLTHLTHVEDVVRAIQLAISTDEVSGIYHIAGPEPILLWELIATLLPRFGYRLPDRKVPIDRAMLAARMMEATWRGLHLRGEPPLTRYKVAVVSYSQTLDTSRARRELGFDPSVSTEEGFASILADVDTPGPLISTGQRQAGASRSTDEPSYVNALFFSVGTVRPSGWLVGKRSRSRVTLPIVAAALVHPTQGVVLFDSGYGPIPPGGPGSAGSMYRRIVAPTADSMAHALIDAGIDRDDVTAVIVSHLHPDHYGGFLEFPAADLIVDAQAWQSLSVTSRRPLHAEVSALPADVATRVRLVDTTAGPIDLAGDGSITLMSLPGHSPGHIGAQISTPGGRYLLCGDAVWTRDQIRNRRKGLNHWIAEDRSAATATIDYLDTLSSIMIVPAHCPDTADEVLGPTWRNPRSLQRLTATVRQ